MRIQCNIETEVRNGLTTEQTWHGRDCGLIACWERGRILALERPEMARRAAAGELLILPWKGGVEAKLKAASRKYGTYQYLAMWLGLRNEDLMIECAEEVTLTCTRLGQDVVFTNDRDKFAMGAGYSTSF